MIYNNNTNASPPKLTIMLTKDLLMSVAFNLNRQLALLNSRTASYNYPFQPAHNMIKYASSSQISNALPKDLGLSNRVGC